MQANGKIKLQIVLSSEARQALYDEGRLVGDRSRIFDEDMFPAYQWMALKMQEKLGVPVDVNDPWPVWAWSSWADQGDVDPNDEEFEDKDLWVLTFEAEPDQVLLSDFIAWHHVVVGWYLPDLYSADGGEAEVESFSAVLEAAGVDFSDRPYPAPIQERVTESWDRVFDVNHENLTVQATFWALHASQVIKEEPCKGTVPDLALKCA